MDTTTQAAVMFMAWGIFLANLIALFIILRFRKNYPFVCENIHCQNSIDYLTAIFSSLSALSIGLITVLDVLISEWNNMLIPVIFIIISFAYFSFKLWRNCAARKNSEKIIPENRECDHEEERCIGFDYDSACAEVAEENRKPSWQE
jgi:hypothetical protein